MITIRLSRTGKKNQPQYSIVVQDKLKAPSSRFLEKVGFYNPLVHPAKIQLNEERVKYWLSKGAKASPTVFNMLVSRKIATGPKISLGRPKRKEEKEEEKKESKPAEKKE